MQGLRRTAALQYHQAFAILVCHTVVYFRVPRYILAPNLDNSCSSAQLILLIDGQNPAPPRMMIIPLFIGFKPSQVVQDFVHQQYHFKPLRKNATIDPPAAKRDSDQRYWQLDNVMRVCCSLGDQVTQSLIATWGYGDHDQCIPGTNIYIYT